MSRHAVRAPSPRPASHAVDYRCRACYPSCKRRAPTPRHRCNLGRWCTERALALKVERARDGAPHGRRHR
eukprot:scaffold4147_cov412-Prasinococcus_capsulatus_cf.AAC.8